MSEGKDAEPLRNVRSLLHRFGWENALLSVCTFNLASGSWVIEAGSSLRSVTIRERTAAQITLR
jgi:hypothetical protein